MPKHEYSTTEQESVNSPYNSGKIPELLLPKQPQIISPDFNSQRGI